VSVPFAVLRIVGKAGALRRVAGQMNKTEARYAELLDARKARGEVAEWHYEALTLKLAHDTRYTPDFLVVLADGTIELHEVKGFWRDDAKVKAKVTATMYPFTVRVARLTRNAWQIEEVAP
jgi:hypothetical protein